MTGGADGEHPVRIVNTGIAMVNVKVTSGLGRSTNTAARPVTIENRFAMTGKPRARVRTGAVTRRAQSSSDGVIAAAGVAKQAGLFEALHCLGKTLS
jgi:hypothetical protein